MHANYNTMKTLYIIRHGQTEYNRKGILQGRRIDAPLNKTGMQQAEAFYDYYKHEGFELVITSELVRSIESIAGFRKLGIPHRIDERITEFSWGNNEGLPLSELVIETYKNMLRSWYMGDLDARIPGGESGRELFERVSSFVGDLKKASEEKILICTHGRTLKALIVQMMGWDIQEMEKVKHSNSALYKLQFANGQYSLELTNDLSHLPDDLNVSAFWDK